MLDLQDQVRLQWIETEDLSEVFLPLPFPPRPARGQLGPLVRSLRAFGCICPILARPLLGRLQVVCGYRRLLAAQAAGCSSLPVLVRELTDDECRLLFAQENSHREPLTAREGRSLSLDLIESGAERPDSESGDQAEQPWRIIPRSLEFEPMRPAAEAIRPPAPLSALEARAQEAVPSREATQPAAVFGTPPPSGSTPASLPPRELLPAAERPLDPALAALAGRAASCFRTIGATRSIPVEEVEEIATDLMALSPLEQGRDLRILCTESPDWLASHSMMVAGLGLHLARALEWTAGQVKKFTLACLLHDVGMLFIPLDCLLAPRALTREQRRVVQRHPQIGRELIQGSRSFGAQIHLVAQDHHERWDGSGYPCGKAGKEVDLPARIVGFLDCFAALVSARPYRPALLYTQALRFMSQATGMGLHDPAILLHFRNIFTELPVGSWLRLGDGRIGRVVGADPGNPSRHRIRLLGEPQGERDEGAVWMETGDLSSAEIPPPVAKHCITAADLSPAGTPVRGLENSANASLS